MKSLRLFIFSLLVSLSSIQLLLATEVQISLYGGGIYFSEINKDEYQQDLFVANQKILTWQYMDKFYAVYGIPYNSKIGGNNLTIKNKTNEVIKKVFFNIEKKIFDTQRIIVNKKYIEPDKDIIKQIKNDAKQLRKARNVWTNMDPDLDFIKPAKGATSGVFGTRRFYNGKEFLRKDELTDETISLFGVWGTQTDNVYICGSHGTILHFDGEEWKVMETGTEEYLLSIWGTSDDNIFVVGDNSSILHFDGKAWSKINPIKEEYFTKVKGLGKDCVYVAGENGTVLRYDGTCWNDMSL